MKKRVGFLGLMIAAAATLFQPAVASAQDRHFQRGYAQHDYREGRFQDHWRDDRYRQPIREDRWRNQVWRDHEYFDRRPVPVYPYRYVAPAPSFGFNWYGR